MPAKAGIPYGLAMFTPRPLSSALSQVAREAIGKDWTLYATLLDHWREIVGEEYAKTASPVKISFPKGKKDGEKWAARGRTGGLLTIKLPQGLAMEFSFLSETLKTRINGFFGYPMIEKIAFEPYCVPKKPKSGRESIRSTIRPDSLNRLVKHKTTIKRRSSRIGRIDTFGSIRGIKASFFHKKNHRFA
jgi:hypothetical protein